MDWMIIDGIGPFFEGLDQKRINWSKAPFHHLEEDGILRESLFPNMLANSKRFAASASRVGYNTVSLDDLAHLADHPRYSAALRERIRHYGEWMDSVISLYKAQGMKVLITADLMFFAEGLEEEFGRSHDLTIGFLRDLLLDLFQRFPGIDGLIFRIGECDGLDVEHDFKSQLHIRSPQVARQYLEALLPLFEEQGKAFIFRTWSVGAYPIGDLIWNRETYHRVFDGIESPQLVISMKYGESDFFRYLPLNKLFFRGHHKKIIELQTKREYEGAGEYPSFVGLDYEDYQQQLEGRPDLVGIMVWCQTGGWTKWRRLTYLENSSIWNELNTYVTLHIFRDGISAEKALEAWCAEERPGKDPADLIELMRLSDRVIKELLYLPEFARRKLFFRRVRVPPLLWVYWDRIIINHSVRKLLRCFVEDGEQSVRQGLTALRKIDQMQRLAFRLDLPVEDLVRMRDTFEILAIAREYYFGEFGPGIQERLKELKAAYRENHAASERYAIKIDFTRVRLGQAKLRWILRLLIREQRGYRMVDRILTIRLLSWLYPLLRLRQRKSLPTFARKQAMGMDAVFK